MDRFVASSTGTVETSVIRDTTLGAMSRGINLEVGPATNTPASVLVRRSLIERSNSTGLTVSGSEAIVEDSVIRDTDAGRGVSVQGAPTGDLRGRATITRSVLSNHREIALYVSGSDAVVEASVVRDTLPDAQGSAGIGVNVQNGEASRSTIDMKYSLVERNHQIGFYVRGSDATVEASVVRDTFLDAQGIAARGVGVQDDPAAGAAAMTFSRSIIEKNRELGLLVSGSNATVEASIIRDTVLDAPTVTGRAIQVQRGDETDIPASASFHACLVERTLEAGIFLAGPATAYVEGCELRSTSTPSDLLGDGIVVWSAEGLATANVLSTRIEESARAGLSSFGGNVTIGDSLLLCQKIDIAVEPWEGRASVFDDRGGVACGCPRATDRCIAQSYALAAPPPIEE